MERGWGTGTHACTLQHTSLFGPIDHRASSLESRDTLRGGKREGCEPFDSPSIDSGPNYVCWSYLELGERKALGVALFRKLPSILHRLSVFAGGTMTRDIVYVRLSSVVRGPRPNRTHTAHTRDIRIYSVTRHLHYRFAAVRPLMRCNVRVFVKKFNMDNN